MHDCCGNISDDFFFFFAMAACQSAFLLIFLFLECGVRFVKSLCKVGQSLLLFFSTFFFFFGIQFYARETFRVIAWLERVLW